MKKNKKNNDKNKLFIMLYVVLSCIFMAFIELIIEPNYLIKSIIKIIMFFGIPFIITRLLKINILNNFKINKKEIIKLFKMGIVIYLVGFILYLILKNVFDFSEIVHSLMVDQQVTKKQLIFVAIYLSFGNSILEEFMFRLISFIKLKEYCSRNFAYIFSSIMFSFYHIAMISIGFPLPLIFLSLIGLFILGILFNWLDEKDNNIYNSWFVHMFCDFLIMTIGFIHM